MGPRRHSFRSVLVGMVLAILTIAVGLIGTTSYLNAKFVVGDLSKRVFEQTSRRIHDRVARLVDDAAFANRVHQTELDGRTLTPDDFPGIARRFREAMLMAPEFTYHALGLRTGDYMHVFRRPSGRIEARFSRFVSEGVAEHHDYDITEDPWVDLGAGGSDFDPRVRPWFEMVKATGAQGWTPVYLFRNPPDPDAPGVTCSSPLRDERGEFLGAVTVDFELASLSRFLGGLRVFERGDAFVAEQDEDGTTRLIAHADPTQVVQPFEDGVGELRSIDAIPRPALRSLARRIPPGIEPGAVAMEQIEFVSEGEAFVGGYRALGEEHGVPWIIGVGVPEQELMGTVRRSNYETALIGLASVLLAILFGMLLARRISGPIQRLAKETEEIAALKLEPKVIAPSSLVEINLLSTALEEMKAGLRSFQRFVPTEVVQATVRGGRDLSIGGERRTMTVLFADLVGFSTLTERCRPEELVRVVNCFLEIATGSIVAHGGTIDKYIGDAVMAFWGAPTPSSTHARDACAAALRIQSQLDDLAHALRFSDVPKPEARIGISTGDLVVGNVGSSIRLNYTVLGDHANLASRLVAINKVFGTRILLSDTTREAAGAAVVARPFEPVLVKGRSSEALVYELIALADDATDADFELVGVSGRLLDAVLARHVGRAEAAARRILDLRPGDAFARTILDDCESMRRGELEGCWSGARRVVVTDGIPD